MSLAPVALRFERPSLISLAFHHVFADEAEIASDLVLPQEAVTLTGFRRVVDHLSEAGYRFVSLGEIVNGLGSSGRFACLTVDDGTGATSGSSTFLTSTRSLLPSSSRRALSRPDGSTGGTYSIASDGNEVRTRTRFSRRFGSSSASRPGDLLLPRPRIRSGCEHTSRGEIDRPLARRELADLATTDAVTVGNHTAGHVVLTHVSRAEMRTQLLGAQEYVQETSGSRPAAVAYPEGAYDLDVLGVAREIRFTCGLTTRRRKERLPLTRDRLLEPGRFQLDGRRDLDAQLCVVGSDVQLANTARRVLRPPLRR